MKRTTHELVHNKVAKGIITQEDATLFLEFINEYSTKNNLSHKSVEKYVHGVCGILSMIQQLDTTAIALSNGTALKLIQAFQAHSWKPETKSTNWKTFKRFYRWLHKNHGPLETKAVYHILGDGTITDKGYGYTIPSLPQKDILTEEEALLMIHTEHDLSWKAFYACAYEGALSFIEISTLRICDVEERDRGFTLNVQRGKNKYRIRSVDIIEYGAAHLERWLRRRRNSAAERALLFTNTKGFPIEAAAANKRLKRLVTDTGTKKSITMHCLRHSRLTSLGDGVLNEFQLNAFAGWAQGSDMAQRYVHSKKLNIRGRLLQSYGYSKEDEVQRNKAGRPCPSCAQLNPLVAKRCGACGSVTDPKEYFKHTTSSYDELLKNYAKQIHADVLAELRVELGLEEQK